MEFPIKCFGSCLVNGSLGVKGINGIRVIDSFTVDEVVLEVLLLVRVRGLHGLLGLLPGDVERISFIKFAFK